MKAYMKYENNCRAYQPRLLLNMYMDKVEIEIDIDDEA